MQQTRFPETLKRPELWLLQVLCPKLPIVYATLGQKVVEGRLYLQQYQVCGMILWDDQDSQVALVGVLPGLWPVLGGASWPLGCQAHRPKEQLC